MNIPVSSSAASSTPGLRKSLGVISGIGLLVGITIGSGIYSTPSIIAGYFDSYSAVITTWVIVGFFVLTGGAIYAELGTRIPSTGGEYMYISRCFGPRAGFLFGWAQLFIIRTSPTAGLAIIATDYIGYFVPLSANLQIVVALSIIALLGVMNVVGVKVAAAFQNTTTAIKVVGLLLFSTAGVLLLSGIANQLGTVSAPTQSLGPVGNVVAALMLIVFSHTGWDRLGYIAGEFKDPRRVIPRAMVIGLSLIMVIYWATNSIYHYALGMDGMRATATPAAQVAELMIGPVGAGIVALLAIISAVGSMNGTMMASSRVYYAMAQDGLFFKAMDYVHPTFRTPVRAIAAHCIWGGVILIARGSFESIAAGMVFAVLIFYTMTTVALFKLRREERGDEDVYRMPLYPVLPVLYLIGIVGLLVARVIYEPEKSLIDFAFVATGIPVSLFWLRKKSTG